jgi:hypothetical protein
MVPAVAPPTLTGDHEGRARAHTQKAGRPIRSPRLRCCMRCRYYQVPFTQTVLEPEFTQVRDTVPVAL